MLKNTLYIYLVSLLLLYTPKVDAQEYVSLCTEETNYITDMVLCYLGGHYNISYTPEHIKTYMYRVDEEGQFHWLYDAFLFLSGKHPDGYAFDATWGKKSATKKEWTWLLDKQFAKLEGAGAIDYVLDSLKQIKIEPIRKRKIVVTLPHPVPNQENWGSVGGKAMNFTSEKDRLKALEWYVEEAIKQWKKRDYKNIELAGFYYFKENTRGDVELIKSIGEFVKKKGYKYYWIPYLWAPGFDKTHELGFDVAYQQPNYFFKKSNRAPITRMDLVCNHALAHNMGMEMEFNDDIQYTFFQMRFLEYLDFFEKYGIWEKASIAYYQDFMTFAKMSKSEDFQIQRLFKRFCKIIEDRQRRADQIYIQKYRKK